MFQSMTGSGTLRQIKQLKLRLARLPTSHLLLVGSFILLVALIFCGGMVALNNALFFDGHAENGAFQLLNPLRRMANGEVIGRDFNFFHGVGVPLLHLPVYYLFGQGIVGAEMARWLVSPLFFVISAFCVFYAFRRKFIFALVATLVATIISMLTIPFLVTPLTSILGVRSVVPIFLLAVILLQKKLNRPITNRGACWLNSFTWYELIVGVLLAMGVICGTEFGAAALIAYVVVAIFYRPNSKSDWQSRAWGVVRTIAVFAIALFGLLSIITLGHPIMPLKYAFLDIPADQSWYFGVPPNRFLYIGGIWRVISSDPMLPIVATTIVVGLMLFGVAVRFFADRIQKQAILFGLLSGVLSLVSMLGYFSGTQASALARMCILIGILSLVVLFDRWRRPISAAIELGRWHKRLKVKPAMAGKALAGLYVVLALVTLIIVVVVIKHNYDIFKTFRKAASYVTGVDTNVYSARWNDVAEMIVPIVQADNNLEILDVNSDGFTHGVNDLKKQVVVDAQDKGKFIHHGQVVYLQGAGRQIIASTATAGGSRVVITLQNKKTMLNPDVDGAPNRLIVSEDFSHNNNKVWSLYTGLLNAEMGLVHPSSGGYDYIIHALGKQRRDDYVSDFSKIQPQYMIGFSPQYFGWENWIENEHWDFYSLLDKNYTMVKETPIYALWKRKDQPWIDNAYSQLGWQQLTIDESDSKIIIPKLSFDNLPDVNEYNQQSMQQERDRVIKMGREPAELPEQLAEDQYYEYVVQRMHVGRLWAQKQFESHGNETDANEINQNLKKAEDDANQLQPELFIPRPKRQIVLVKVRYEASQPLSWIPLLGRTSRFMLETNNVFSKTAISLRPYANEAIFPVVISELNDDSYVRYKTYSLLPGGGLLKITDAQYTVLETSVENLKLLTD